MKHSFCHYYLHAFIRPGKVFALLASDNRRVAMGGKAVSVSAGLYTLVYVFLTFGGGRPFHPWLAIPPESYYRYNILFCAPSMFLGWILAAGVVHVVSRLLTAGGSFEQVLATFGFGIGIAPWATGLHDLLTSFLGAVHVIDQREFEAAMNAPTVWRWILWALMLAYVAWFIVLFSKGVWAVYGLSPRRAAGLGAVGFAVYQLFFFIFNR